MTVDAAQLAALVGRVRGRFGLPAVAATVLDAAGVAAEWIEGERVLGRGVPATLDDSFHIGSCSKSVLAVLAAGLVEEGRIAWDTRLFEAAPELEAGANAAYAGVTLEDLFVCEAGIAAFTDGAREPLPTFDAAGEDARWAFARDLVARPPAVKRRGDRFLHLYSNASYALAALMLERVSGLRYEAHARRTLVDGWGLAVHVGWPHDLGVGQPWGHMLGRSGVTAFGPEHPYRIPELLTPDEDFALTVMTNAGSGSGSMRAVDALTMAIVKRRFGWWWRVWP